MLNYGLESLSWELSVLARAVTYKNLSGAAQNVGISQPQLSRILGRIESQLQAVLLDRSSRRKAAWTPLAHQLAQAYLKSSRSLNGEIAKLLEGSEPRLIHIGTLEGLMPLALRFGHHVLTKTGVSTLDLDVFDLNDLEQKFFQGDLDLIFTAREPGRKKFSYSRTLGYQNLELLGGDETPFVVMSSYEYGIRSARPSRKTEPSSSSKVLISNSLSVRKRWLEEFGGAGTLPSEVRSSKKDARREKGARVLKEEEVYLFGQDHLSPPFWEKLAQFKP